MSEINIIKAFYQNNRIKSRFLFALVIIILLLVVIRISLSEIIIYSTQSWLGKQGINASIDDIRIDIIAGTVSLHNANGSKDGQPLFDIGLIDIHLNWSPLSEKTIEINKVTLDGLNVAIKHYRDEIIIGGVSIPLQTKINSKAAGQHVNVKAEIVNELAEPWAAALNKVVLRNLNVCYLQHHAERQNSNADSLFVDYCVNVDEMAWQGHISYATNKMLIKNNELPIVSSGNFKLSGLSVVDNSLKKYILKSASNELNNVVISGLNDIHIDEINMNDLSSLQRDDTKHKDALRFKQFNIKDIHFKNLNKLHVGNIEINDPGVYLVRVNKNYWEYQQWLPESSLSTISVVGETDKTELRKVAVPFEFAIDNISLNKADACYLDKSRNLYYCVTFDTLNWLGAINYSTLRTSSNKSALKIKGALSLKNTRVQNHSIQRALLTLDSLELQGVDINDFNHALLQHMELDGLAALQISEKKADNTFALEKFSVSNVEYKKSGINIDEINISQLQGLISKNEDSRWEHDKWRITDSAKDVKADITKNAINSKSEAKPFSIVLNKLNINSNKNIIYVDNSTTPAMSVGVQELRFDLLGLNSNTPDNNSQFKFFTKTVRHSTAELAGTIKPFAKKVSFDAQGQLKGFDLRVATPVTKKSIGHIIQSGQMDADLKLRAIDGILDSNIALSLYQFQIKALNDINAKKLDEKFGMPLNKTLILLRNKDGSIHLDIPVRGDVNNPSFQPMDAIIKATTKAATVTLITFYTPYGLAYAGGNLMFDLATALNFEPVRFENGSAELTAENIEQLDKLAILMTEKPQLHLTLCGKSNLHDVYALFPDLKPDAGNALTSELNAKQIKEIKNVSQQRQINSKQYLVGEKHIEHDRLILCAPDYELNKEAIAGVEIII